MASIRSVILQLALPALFITQTAAQSWLASELSQVNSYNYVRFTECTSFISTCPPTISACATAVCGQCTSLGGKLINSCCAGADPVACFSSYRANEGPAPATTTVAGSGYGSSAPSTGAVFSSEVASDTGFTTGTMTATGSPLPTTGSETSMTESANTNTATAATLSTSSSKAAADIVEAHFAPAFGCLSMFVAALAAFL